MATPFVPQADHVLWIEVLRILREARRVRVLNPWFPDRISPDDQRPVDQGLHYVQQDGDGAVGDPRDTLKQVRPRSLCRIAQESLGLPAGKANAGVCWLMARFLSEPKARDSSRLAGAETAPTITPRPAGAGCARSRRLRAKRFRCPATSPENDWPRPVMFAMSALVFGDCPPA